MKWNPFLLSRLSKSAMAGIISILTLPTWSNAEVLCVAKTSKISKTGQLALGSLITVRTACKRTEAEVFNTSSFIGPKGEPGVAGATGPKGDPGPQGEPPAPYSPSSPSDIVSFDVSSSVCPAEQFFSLYTVPAGRDLVVTQVVGRGTNAGYTKMGAVSGGQTDWKVNGRLYNLGPDGFFRYTSPYGMLFKSGSTMIATCEPAGEVLNYHIEGYLVDHGAEIGLGGSQGPKLPSDLVTVDSLNDSSTCPTNQTMNLYTVPQGRYFVVKEISAKGTNAGYSKLGESLSSGTTWKISAFTHNSSAGSFRYSSPQGLIFRPGSSVIASCEPAGEEVEFHLDGYLTE